jgi:hypothetical protein
MARDYDRYKLVKNTNGTIDQLPFIPISSSTADKYVEWIVGKSRLDKLSQQYYGTPVFDWLILYSNPEFISEFDIVDGATIRIPFPLDRAIGQYQEVLSEIRSE